MSEPAGLNAPATPWTRRPAWRAQGPSPGLLLAIASGACMALVLYLTRDTTLWWDDLGRFPEAVDPTLGDLLEPVNGHLILTTRILFTAVLMAFGPQDIFVFRIVSVLLLSVCSLLVFVLVRRRLGPEVALAPAILLLFFGTAWINIIGPAEQPILFCTAAGLAALAAIETWPSLRGDLIACAMLVISVASFTGGLAFLAAVAVWILLGRRGPSGLWVVLVPGLLYVAWRIWAADQISAADEPELSDLLLTFNAGAVSLASVMAGLSGLGYGFPGDAQTGLVEPNLLFGSTLAIVALAVIGYRFLFVGRPAPSSWALLTLLAAYWAMLALAASPAPSYRTPSLARYLLIATVGVILLFADAFRDRRISRKALTLIWVVTAISLTTNIAILRDAARYFRDYSAETRAEMALIELRRDRISPDFRPRDNGGNVNITVGEYLTAVDELGSPVDAEAVLAHGSAADLKRAESVLAPALKPSGG